MFSKRDANHTESFDKGIGVPGLLEQCNPVRELVQVLCRALAVRGKLLRYEDCGAIGEVSRRVNRMQGMLADFPSAQTECPF